MRRFLGANLATSTSPSTSDSEPLPSPNALNGYPSKAINGIGMRSTSSSAVNGKRPLWAGGAFSRSNSSSSSNVVSTNNNLSQQQATPQRYREGSDDPPTPPSKSAEQSYDVSRAYTNGKDAPIDLTLSSELDGNEGEWDALKLPFGRSVAHDSTSQSTTSPSTARMATSVPSVFSNPTSPTSPTSNADGSMNLFSSMEMGASRGLVDLKDEMLMDLLSSDALIHVHQFEVLSFEEVDELRKVRSRYLRATSDSNGQSDACLFRNTKYSQTGSPSRPTSSP